MMASQGNRQRSPGFVVTVLCMIGVVAAVEGTLLVPLISRLPEIYDVSVVQASWLITSTLLSAALATPILTRLADMYGERPIVVIALGALVLGSLMLALSDNFAVGIAGRSLQGLSAALVPVAISVMKAVLPPQKVGFGISMMSATLGSGSAVGLPLAGFMFGHYGWASLFWMTAIAGSILVVLAWVMLPAPETASQDRFDWLGAILLISALTPLILVLTQGNEWGWSNGRILTLSALTVVAFVLWTLWELRANDPLVDVRVLASRSVALTNIASIVIAMAMLINLYLAAQQLGVPGGVAGGLGLSAAATGLVMAVPAGSLAAVSPGVARLLARYGGRTVMIMGALVMATSYFARVWLDDSVLEVVLGASLVCVGTSLALSSMPMIIMSVVPPSQTASAMGVNALCRMMGTALSTAAVAALSGVTSTQLGGVEYPTTETYHVAFWGCAALTMAAAALIWLVPRDVDALTRNTPTIEKDELAADALGGAK